ncbi:hypothetical protein, partial [Paenirhodobacter populi]|uniref:hypothetical protein n=1 Tax=Paenirhodobacter populi TaxID=2306993 RepID=UPI003612D0BC
KNVSGRIGTSSTGLFSLHFAAFRQGGGAGCGKNRPVRFELFIVLRDFRLSANPLKDNRKAACRETDATLKPRPGDSDPPLG